MIKLHHLLATSVLGACVSLPLLSGETPPAKSRPMLVAQKEKATEGKKSTPRLPNRFGKLELTDAQREKIAGIQTKYNAEIEKLEVQMEQLKEKRDGELQAVLTAEQKQKFKSLDAAAKKKREANSKTDEK